MKDIINITEEVEELHSWMGHIILDADSELVSKLVSAEGYDSTKIEMSVTLNGIEIRKVDIEKLLKDWVARCSKQFAHSIEQERQKLENENTKEGINSRAITIAKQKLQDMVDKLEWETE
jgi:hypothetical protein